MRKRDDRADQVVDLVGLVRQFGREEVRSHAGVDDSQADRRRLIFVPLQVALEDQQAVRLQEASQSQTLANRFGTEQFGKRLLLKDLVDLLPFDQLKPLLTGQFDGQEIADTPDLESPSTPKRPSVFW